MLGLLTVFGINFYDTIEPLIKANPVARIEWEGCEKVYRGNELLNILGEQVGITSEQLDSLFRIIKGEIPITPQIEQNVNENESQIEQNVNESEPQNTPQSEQNSEA